MFLAPGRLWLLAMVVGLAAAYLMTQQRRRRYAVRFTNLELLASVAPGHPGWRRHLPAAALLGALALLVVGYARPTRQEQVPRTEGTVVLAVDVSHSMRATDVDPNRLTAAQTAATDFAERLPPGIRLGLIAFDGVARVLVAPTADRFAVTEAIAGLEVGPGTAAGDAVYVALATIRAALPDPGLPDPGLPDTGLPDPGLPDPGLPDPGLPDGGVAVPDPESSAARIVVMSDGKTTLGQDLDSAAEAAKEANVPVSTVAFGTVYGTVTIEGQMIPVPPDEEALARLAEVTGGESFTAATSDELRKVYAGIGTQAAFTTEQREITATLVGLGLVLLVLAAGGSLLWTARLP